MAMRPPGYWVLNSLTCSTAASQSSPVWITRNSGWCSWSLLGTKSSAHDTEARMRKLAERRILASPSLSKMLFQTSIIAKDCRWRMMPYQHVRFMALDRPIKFRSSYFGILFGFLRALLSHRKKFNGQISKARRLSHGSFYLILRFLSPISPIYLMNHQYTLCANAEVHK